MIRFIAPSNIDFKEKVVAFEQQWQHGVESIPQKTSGSSGAPKSIEVSRDQMIKSASLTMGHLGLNSGTALLCLNPDFIAGKMMMIRAIEYGMDLMAIEPVLDPFQFIPDNQQIDFVAMVPMQLQATLRNPISLKAFNKVKTAIVGGAPVSIDLDEACRNLNPTIYETFGMTETVSHIALRKLGGVQKEPFRAFREVTLGQDERGCLTILSPLTNNELLVSNDLVELRGENAFEWIGRFDNVINSGGIKLQIETIEKKIRQILRGSNRPERFIIAGTEDQNLGEKVTLILEAPSISSETKEELTILFAEYLDTYERPKEIYYLTEFVETPTGKIQREETISLLDL